MGRGRRNKATRYTSEDQITRGEEGSPLSPRFFRSPRFNFNRGTNAKVDKDPNDNIKSRVLKARWEHVSQGGLLSGDKVNLMCPDTLQENVYAAAAGPTLEITGVTEFSVTIVKSHNNVGSSMLIGVVEDVGFRGRSSRSNAPWARVWGLAPWNGRILGFPHGDFRDPRLPGEITGDSLMQGDCRGSADGTLVHVRLDAPQRRLYYRVNEDKNWVLARDGTGPITMPDGIALRPFARVGNKGDCIALRGAMEQTTIKVAKPSTETKPAPLPIQRLSDDEVIDARVAELLEAVDRLRKELDSTRLQLEGERMLRIKAEMAEKEASRRAEEAMRASRRRVSGAPLLRSRWLQHHPCVIFRLLCCGKHCYRTTWWQMLHRSTPLPIPLRLSRLSHAQVGPHSCSVAARVLS